MEPAQPIRDTEGWEKSALGKFYSRHGQHFQSIAWYVDDLAETCAWLSGRNIRLFDISGHLVTEPWCREGAVWTHPRDTHCAFEFAAAPKFYTDPRLQPGWSAAFARDEHPLGIERASHVTMLFRNLDDAQKVYEQALGGSPIYEDEIRGHKRSVFYALGEDTIVEALQPLSATSPEGIDIERVGEGVYSVTFKTKDLKRAAEHLRKKGQPISEDGHLLTIHRKDAFGMVIGFTDKNVPNDPR